MNLFSECEIARHLLRGQTAVIIAGPRAATAAELAGLAAEFAETFGTRHTPIYFSADGWQRMEFKAARAKAPAKVDEGAI